MRRRGVALLGALLFVVVAIGSSRAATYDEWIGMILDIRYNQKNLGLYQRHLAVGTSPHLPRFCQALSDSTTSPRRLVVSYLETTAARWPHIPASRNPVVAGAHLRSVVGSDPNARLYFDVDSVWGADVDQLRSFVSGGYHTGAELHAMLTQADLRARTSFVGGDAATLLNLQRIYSPDHPLFIPDGTIDGRPLYRVDPSNPITRGGFGRAARGMAGRVGMGFAGSLGGSYITYRATGSTEWADAGGFVGGEAVSTGLEYYLMNRSGQIVGWAGKAKALGHSSLVGHGVITVVNASAEVLDGAGLLPQWAGGTGMFDPGWSPDHEFRDRTSKAGVSGYLSGAVHASSKPLRSGVTVLDAMANPEAIYSDLVHGSHRSLWVSLFRAWR